MNVQPLLDQLAKDGLTVELRGGDLRVTPRAAVKPEHEDALRANKEKILAYLRSEVSRTATKEPTSTQSIPGSQPIAQSETHKRYSMPDGSVLELTREEFDAVVDAFRQLAAADVRLGSESPCRKSVSDAGEGDVRTNRSR